MPSEPVPEVMRRTMFNLKFIKKHQDRNGPYEVTQLVNSFLGALAHPWETYRNDLMRLPLSEAERRGWPKVKKEQLSDRDPDSLGDLLRLVRNSFAHGNVQFLPDERNGIQAIRFWNTSPKSGKRTWGAILTVGHLESFLKCFVALAEELHQSTPQEDLRSA